MLNELNEDYKTRDAIIFGSYDKDKYLGGCRRFTCSRDIMKKLIENKFIHSDECQNFSPTTKEFMEATEDINDVSFSCYAISPERDDYRVTIEGVDIEIPDDDYDTIGYLVETFHGADEFGFNHNRGSYFLHAWWD